MIAVPLQLITTVLLSLLPNVLLLLVTALFLLFIAQLLLQLLLQLATTVLLLFVPAVLAATGATSKAVSYGLVPGSGEDAEDGAAQVDLAAETMTQASMDQLQQQQDSCSDVSPEEVKFFTDVKNRYQAVKSDTAKAQV